MATITNTFTKDSITVTNTFDVAARGPVGPTGPAGVTALSSLTTVGYSSPNMLRVAAAGGVEQRTPAQVLADISALPASGNAVSATKLATARTIASQPFDGSANISITAANVGAVATSGNETVGGNKTFSGQLQLTGQAAADANSAITRSLGDARYPGIGDVPGTMPVTAFSSNVTAVIGYLTNCTSSASPFTVTLPPAATNSGKSLSIKIDQSQLQLVTIKGNASELIDGQNTRVMWKGEFATLTSNGTSWFKSSGQSLPMNAKYARLSAFSIPNALITTILIDATVFSNGIGSSFSTFGLYASRSGWYRATAQLGYNGLSASASSVQCRISKNGAIGSALAITAIGVNSGVSPVIQSYAYTYLNSGEYVTFEAYQNSGSSATIQTGDFPTITLEEISSW